MKIFSDVLPVPPLPPPTAPREPAPEAAVTIETPRRGRPQNPPADPRMDGFAAFLRDQDNAVMTIGSYVAAVSAVIRRGVAPDAPDSALAHLDLSPASLALYARAWRAWRRYLGLVPDVDEAAVRRKLVQAFCNAAKGKKPKISDLKSCRWSSLGTLVLDRKQHFTLTNGEHTWLWAATPDRLATLRQLVQMTSGSAMTDDPIQQEQMMEAIADRPVLE